MSNNRETWTVRSLRLQSELSRVLRGMYKDAGVQVDDEELESFLTLFFMFYDDCRLFVKRVESMANKGVVKKQSFSLALYQPVDWHATFKSYSVEYKKLYDAIRKIRPYLKNQEKEWEVDGDSIYKRKAAPRKVKLGRKRSSGKLRNG